MSSVGLHNPVNSVSLYKICFFCYESVLAVWNQCWKVRKGPWSWFAFLGQLHVEVVVLTCRWLLVNLANGQKS